jgi:23S rRNA (uracil1939-C5)-methyltransferase
VPDRDDCPHRPPCPGCPRFGITALPQRAWESLTRLAREAGLPEPPIHRLPGRGHRHRARLAVRGKARSPKIGLFQSGSHRIVDTPDCRVHHPLINETARRLRESIRESGVEPYADRPHRGTLRYVQIVVERATDRVQVVLVGRGTQPEILGELPNILAKKLGSSLQGLFFNGQPERSNAILGPTTLRLAGEPMTREAIAGVHVFFPPGAFGQNHLPLYELAVERVATLVPERSVVAELHCGVGSIGLGLLAGAQEIRFNERSPDGLAGLEAGLEARPPEERSRARLFAGAAEDRLDALPGAEVVIVDPPRRGLGTELLAALVSAPPRRLVYLACGLDSLLRDLEALRASGRLRLAGLEVFDFFPFTEHVETLAWLDAPGEQFGR